MSYINPLQLCPDKFHQSYLETDRAPKAIVVGQVPPHPADPGGHEALVRRQHAEDVEHGRVSAAHVRREVIPEGGGGGGIDLLRLTALRA